jgi:hypothetical protein
LAILGIFLDFGELRTPGLRRSVYVQKRYLVYTPPVQVLDGNGGNSDGQVSPKVYTLDDNAVLDDQDTNDSSLQHGHSPNRRVLVRINEIQEIPQKLQPISLALFWMELRGEDVLLLYGSHVWSTVFASRRDNLLIAVQMKTVIEVKVSVLLNAPKQRIFPIECHTIPTYVRNSQSI